MFLSIILRLRQALLALFGALFMLATATAPPVFAQDAPVGSLDDAAAAVVRIEAVGTFLDFYEGEQQNVPGYGSGFIIDPSGIVVTNNHVVTGGALYRVYVGGSSRPVNARVLGVSECSDLAVIDLQGDGYPYLAWSPLIARRALPVYAAGYPLGNADFEITDGRIVSITRDGETDWASLDYTFEHSASIRPGNSGGPLLDMYGRVLAVNYARNDDGEAFAIPAAIAEPLATTLADGADVDSLGINGVVVTSDKESGIWISSVASGTPADQLGLHEGDIILKLEKLDVGLDGTMLDYCDIIQSHGTEDVMAVEIYRSESDELYSGQFNGRELAVVPIDELASEELATTSNGEYETVRDSSGAVSFDVPVSWADTRERPWNWDGTVVGSQLIVAPNVEGFLEDWGVPGVALSWSTSLQDYFTPQQIVDAVDLTDECSDVTHDDLDDDGEGPGYTAFYSGCPGDTAVFIVSIDLPAGGLIYKFEFHNGLSRDIDAFSRFITSISFIPGLISDNTAHLKSVVDNSRRIFVSVPDTWKDISSEPIEYEGEIIGASFVAAVSVQDFDEHWGKPGFSIWVYDDFPGTDLDDWLDLSGLGEYCTHISRLPYENEKLAGKYDLWTNCGGTKSLFRHYALLPKDGADLLVSADLVVVSRAESDAVQAIVDSLSVLSPFSATDYALVDHGFITVIAENLNVRDGPSTSSNIISQVAKGTQFEVVGQFNDCAWHLIEDANGKLGWVSGDSKYTQLTGACADIPAVTP